MRWLVSARDAVAILVALFLAAGCRDSADSPDANPGVDAPDDASTGYPPPRKNLVATVGARTTLEIAAWNIENFPMDMVSTAALVADLVASMDLDVIVVEEIASESKWNELTARLPEHESVLSPHVYSGESYQKLGVLYRKGLVKVRPLELLFNGQTGPFPRPPIKVAIEVDDGVHAQVVLDLIGVHLKAGVTTDDRMRRAEAMTILDNYVRTQIATGGEDDVIILGDFNEVVTDAGGQATWAPFLAAPTAYKVQTAAYAQAGGVTYLGFGGRAIDHIVTTTGLAAEVAGGDTVVPALQNMLNGYRTIISDHLPVVLRVPLR